MIPRDAHTTLETFAAGFPIVGITGPRQSGKTTLARAVFNDRPYASLEDPDTRAFAIEDPRGFLDGFPGGAILDEVQRCPSLFSYLQTRVDQTGRNGEFILTGSQQFGMVSAITQSLAGRAGLLALLPFALSELGRVGRVPPSVDDAVWRGAYPPVHDRPIDPSIWYSNYVQTYLERDVHQLIQVRDLAQFQRFVRLCAGRTGQLLNQSALADETGVSHNTIREWLSVLEASYIIHRLPPQHRNFNKRLVKTPKLYFVDTGLAAWLLGIETVDQLSTHPLRGELFETWVVSEHLKYRFNAGRASNLTFWRDRHGHEVDLLVEKGDRLQPIEIKAGATVHPDAFRGLLRWLELAGDRATAPELIYAGDRRHQRHNIAVRPWRDVAEPASG